MIQSQARAHPNERMWGREAHVSIRLSSGIRLAWLLLFVGGVWLVIAGLPFLLVHYSSICPDQLCFPLPQLNRESAQFVTRLGVSLDTYARTMTGFDLIFVACWWLVGTLLIWRRPLDPVALIAAYVSLVIPASYYLNLLGPTTPGYSLALKIHTFFNGISLIWLFALFPDGHWVPRWTRYIALAYTGYYALYALFAVPERQGNLLVAFQGPLVLVTLGFVLAIQVYRYRHFSNPTQRQQTLWLLFGIGVLMTNVLIGLAFLASGHVGTWQLPVIVACYLGEIILPLALGVAILRYRLFDIDVIINRTLVYATLTALVAGGYVLIVGGLGALLQAQASLALSLLATGVIAVLFQPLRERIQRAVNHLLYGQRAEPYAVVARLGGRLGSAFVPTAILPTITQTLAESLRLPYVAIGLDPRDASQIAAATGTIVGTPVRLPLHYQGAEVGHLLISPRRGEADLSPADRRLLTDLAQQAGVAVHGVRLMNELRRLNAYLQRSREGLVLAREEERRRIRRDLHDDLAPTLAGLALSADTVADLVPTHPERAEALARTLHQQIRAAAGGIRRLVHDLRPPTLDEYGLLAAIRERATQLGARGTLSIRVEACAELPALPAAVEVAAYRIVQEALMNVVNHAQARHCRVALALDEALEIVVADDGIGLTEARVPGVGLRSMRERAEELGGTLVLEPSASGGTHMRVRLPVQREAAP